ncbi:MAG: hypothetical protein ACOVO1_11280 [Chitinophagaceae bacterium]
MKKFSLLLTLILAITSYAQNSLNKVQKKDSIAKYIGNGVYLTITGCIGDAASQKITLYFTLTNPSKAHQKIKIDPWNEVPVGAFDANGNQFPFGTVNLANQNGFGQVESELPTGLMVKGYINFINVHNKPKALAHITIPVSSGNWPSSSDLLQELVEINNVKVNWDSNTFPYEDQELQISKMDFLKQGYNKNICNGLDVYYTGCVGDAGSQTVTVYYIIANYNKVNQKITIDPFATKQAFAFDYLGNKFSFNNVQLVQEVSDGSIECIIPTNLYVKGSITFSNVLPITNTLGIVNFNIKSENWNGSGNEVEDAVQFSNVKIDWKASDNPNEIFEPSKSSKTVNNIIKNEVSVVPNKTIKLNNDLDFVMVKCEGDSVNQSVTLHYTFFNKRKPHQRVGLSSSISDVLAFDSKGSNYKANSMSIGEGSNDNVTTIIPTGFSANGSITFINVFPFVDKFSLVSIPINSSNKQDEGNEKSETLFLKNVAIKWIKINPKTSYEKTEEVQKPTQPVRRRRN